MAYSITLTNTNSKVYRFFDGEVASASYSLNEKKIQESIAGGDAEDSISINLGKTVNIRFNFKLLNTPGQDASVGSQSGGVYDIDEKLAYLLDTFITTGTEDFYTIEVLSNTGNISTKKCSVDSFSFDFSSQNPNSLTGNFSFVLGGGNQ